MAAVPSPDTPGGPNFLRWLQFRVSGFECPSVYQLVNPSARAVSICYWADANRRAYGIVCAAIDSRTNQQAAIKKIGDISATRWTRGARCARSSLAPKSRVQLWPAAAQILRHVRDHSNVITLPTSSRRRDVCMVYEIMDTDLHQIISSPQPLSDEHMQFFIYQLKYLHSAEVVHRDLKPSNLLLSDNCVLRICDFGPAACPTSPKEYFPSASTHVIDLLDRLLTFDQRARLLSGRLPARRRLQQAHRFPPRLDSRPRPAAQLAAAGVKEGASCTPTDDDTATNQPATAPATPAATPPDVYTAWRRLGIEAAPIQLRLFGTMVDSVLSRGAEQPAPVDLGKLGDAAQRRQLAQLQTAVAKGGARRLEHYVHNVVGALNLAPAMFGQRETYLDAVRRRQDREALAQLHNGAHWGTEETGRWLRRPREGRVCPHCHALPPVPQSVL
ncbi:hypothetical protein CHLNCDRAFT_50203 [Chlorella variabilis]|uniref:Protein kinase domain-containing protein n=1 Tax=Chlorella variabilis TaxID=554065 RepID=E1Z6Z3_CHLVA|nr:hypothetical protein CHLNCDRAFT_50203 [Chlorella variabilis]EFN58440.1 hypothetical protein CHLNCDRAFT_50203 [Chlorella variabilis]|eukprot:XP_005850542.1 hypothetical protein CHLNCDRAFT_50203 [Chlorella variabilis]